MLFFTDETEPCTPIFIQDTGGDGISGIARDDPLLSILICPGGAVTFSPVALVAKTVGAGLYQENTLEEMTGPAGFYLLCMSPTAIVSNKTSIVVVTYGLGKPQRGLILPRLNSLASILSGVDNLQDADLEFNFNIPGTEPVNAASGTLYVKEKGRTLKFIANQDIESIGIDVIIENSDQTDKLIFTNAELAKTGTEVVATLPDGFTDEIAGYTWGIRNSITQEFYGSGSFSVAYAPYDDTLP